MEWFRFYHRVLDNPRVQKLTRETRGGWLDLLCLASMQPARGTLPDLAECAFRLRLTEDGAAELIAKLRSAGLIERARKPSAGSLHNWDKLQKASDDALGRQHLFRGKKDEASLASRVRARDGNHCRYCWKEVNWQDRRGLSGGCYDHVDPTKPGTYENLIVACRSCNSSKGSRTPQEWGRELRQPKIGESASLLDTDLDTSPGVFRSVSKSDLDTPNPPSPPLEPPPISPREEIQTERREDERRGSVADAALEAVQTACAVLVPFVTRGFEPDRGNLEKAASTYPLIDLELEFRKLADWLRDPQHRKERVSWRRIFNWLAKAEQDRVANLAAPTRNGSTNGTYVAPGTAKQPPPPTLSMTPEEAAASDAARQRVREQIKTAGIGDLKRGVA